MVMPMPKVEEMQVNATLALKLRVLQTWQVLLSIELLPSNFSSDESFWESLETVAFVMDSFAPYKTEMEFFESDLET